MNASTNLKTVRQPTKAVVVSTEADPRPLTLSEQNSEVSAAIQPTPQADAGDSARFREDILQRSEAPLRLAWRHGGLND
jgi:hypothetical protein